MDMKDMMLRDFCAWPAPDLKEKWAKMRDNNDRIGLWADKAMFASLALRVAGSQALSERVGRVAVRISEIAESRHPDGIDGNLYREAKGLYAMAVAAAEDEGCLCPGFADL